MTSFQRWLMSALALSCLVLSFYSYTINHNLEVVEDRQRGQIATTGQSLWFSWYHCADKLTWALRAVDSKQQADVVTYLYTARIHCSSASEFTYNYNAALDWSIKPWWNLGLGSGDVIGFVRLFYYYSSQIGSIISSIREDGSVSPANRARIQQLYEDLETLTEQIPEAMLQEGDIAKIHEALAGWCGMVNDVKAKETIILTDEQYLGVCEKDPFAINPVSETGR
ncbi:hypothetical protein [Herpetosiphon gulosus]|uniref:Uncharacterized protein n=1 Tax=Herpetosiphon gulosus TaxID=1973496 RepID=A0ABP9X4U5_9CHLR